VYIRKGKIIVVGTSFMTSENRMTGWKPIAIKR